MQARIEQAKALLSVGPMSRHELECKLGISQQRVSEVLRTINAHVIGYEPRHTRGHPHPIYALTPDESTEHDFTQLTSVWR